MSTHIDTKKNQCYTIYARKFYDEIEKCMMLQLTTGDSEHWVGIALCKRDAIDLCTKIIQSLNEVE